jgi:hypothetical protein
LGGLRCRFPDLAPTLAESTPARGKIALTVASGVVREIG